MADLANQRALIVAAERLLLHSRWCPWLAKGCEFISNPVVILMIAKAKVGTLSMQEILFATLYSKPFSPSTLRHASINHPDKNVTKANAVIVHSIH